MPAGEDDLGCGTVLVLGSLGWAAFITLLILNLPIAALTVFVTGAVGVAVYLHRRL